MGRIGGAPDSPTLCSILCSIIYTFIQGVYVVYYTVCCTASSCTACYTVCYTASSCTVSSCIVRCTICCTACCTVCYTAQATLHSITLHLVPCTVLVQYDKHCITYCRARNICRSVLHKMHHAVCTSLSVSNLMHYIHVVCTIL